MARRLNRVILLAVVALIGGMGRFSLQQSQREKSAGLAQIASAMAEVQGLKRRIRMYFLNHGVMPAPASRIDLPMPVLPACEEVRVHACLTADALMNLTVRKLIKSFRQDAPQGAGNGFLSPGRESRIDLSRGRRLPILRVTIQPNGPTRGRFGVSLN